MVGYWRSHRAALDHAVGDELGPGDELADAAIDVKQIESEPETEDGEPESEAPAVSAATGEARASFVLDDEVRMIRSALSKREGFDPAALSALATLLAALKREPSEALNAEVLRLLDDFHELAKGRLSAELLPAALQFAAALKEQAAVASPKIVEFASMTEAARTREESLATLEGTLQSKQISESRFERAGQALARVLAAEPGNPRALKLMEELEARCLSEARAFAEQSDFVLAEQRLARALSLRADSSLTASVRAEIQALKVTREGEALGAFERALSSAQFADAERALDQLKQLKLAADTLEGLASRLGNARIYGGFKPGEVFSDPLTTGNSGPAMRVIPTGSYLMGSDAGELGHRRNEAPTRRIRFRVGFAIAQSEVSVGEFRAFVNDSRYKTDAERLGWSAAYQERSGRFVRSKNVNWQKNFQGETAKDKQPVVHVSYNDAKAFAAWLSAQSGKPYRLPSEAEFEYATRAGTQSRYWWGDATPSSKVENLTGEFDQSRSKRRWNSFFEGYSDGFWGPAAVRSFKANAFGLFDLSGNVSEWTEDCWHDSYTRAPDGPEAWVNPGCELRVIRGGSWGNAPEESRSAYRQGVVAESRSARVGFRVVRDL